MVMRFCPGGDLFLLLRRHRRFDEGVVKFYAAQVLLGLEYLHSSSVVYRDLKPENLMVTETGYIRISDMGFARLLKGYQRAWTFCGTAEYMPPEIIDNIGHAFPADWWSFGILLYELATQRTPMVWGS
ncbi:unnamed protein product [Notodromas monacha]|uniref:Protein kinase domain-containing protein n=1 Tax=Notodromas monacha TaxID=399045 RepID=A0A7R9BZV4_9CRUS|nr:unnamed protein product [Notodromas monacha]CAG0923389.1 unnamed protein product [Notodromas monacha]